MRPKQRSVTEWLGLQYILLSFGFMFLGLCLIAYLKHEGAARADLLLENGSSEWLRGISSLHGFVMVFLGVVPLATWGYGFFSLPEDSRISRRVLRLVGGVGLGSFVIGGVTMLLQALLNNSFLGTRVFLGGFLLVLFSSLVNAALYLYVFARGWRCIQSLPVRVWSHAITTLFVLVSYLPLFLITTIQMFPSLAWNYFGVTVFEIEGVAIKGQGGEASVWQQVVWYLSHPEVYVMLLPAISIVSQVIERAIGRESVGYKAQVFSLLFLASTSLVVLLHFILFPSQGMEMVVFYRTMGLALFLPLIVNIACLFQTLRRNSVHSSPELLFGVSSLVMILAGALFGIPLLLGAEQSSKSYYMLGHFHYLFGPGAIFAFFAGVYSFGSQIFGKKLNETLSYLHFWPTLFGMNVVFLPMVILGVLGIAGEDILESGVSVAREVVFLQQISSSGVFFLLVSQLPFLLNCLFAICRPEFWARFDMLQERASAAIQPGSTY